ncbi:MAG: glycosyltransferase family 2 protein [Candidatus Methanoperedens sp.]|nr:glycosyltransferase family 2 protein [Candidatus Methanoperedens sp.]
MEKPERRSKITTIAAMPAFNEEKYIAKVIVGCRKYVDKVIVLDDGSTDATAEIAEALGAIVIKHPENRGYGAALQTIFKTAREMNVDAMVILDSDGQHDPKEIPKLLGPLNNGTDIVIGSRFINANGPNVPAYRKAGMKVLDVVTNIAGGINVSDSQSGFRAYGRKAIEKIRINENDMPAGSEILMQIKDHDLKFKEVEIHCNYDVEDTSSQNPMTHGFSVLMSILNTIGEKRPIMYLGLPGTILIIIGIFYGGWTLQLYSSNKILPIGNALISVMTTLIGVFSVFTAIILYTMTNFIQRLGLVKRP